VTKQLKKNQILAILALAAPISFTQIAMFGLILMDTFMVSYLGQQPIAGVGVGGLIFYSYISFNTGLMSSLEVFISVDSPKSQNRNWMTISLFLSLCISVVGFVLLRWIAGNLDMLRLNVQVAEYSSIYLYAVSWCVFPYTFFLVFRHTLQALKKPMFPVYAAILGLLGNFILNWYFIFGNMDNPQLGTEGAGIATTLTRSLMLLFLFFSFIRTDGFVGFTSISFSQVKRFVSIGLPISILYFFRTACFAMLGLLVGTLGVPETVTHTVLSQVGSIFTMVAVGLSSSISIYASQSARPQDYVLPAVKISMWIALFAGVIVFFSFDLIIALFTDSPASVALAKQLQLLFYGILVMDLLVIVALGWLKGCLQTLLPSLVSLLSFVVMVLVAYYLCCYTSWGVFGIWSGIFLGFFIATVGTWAILLRSYRRSLYD